MLGIDVSKAILHCALVDGAAPPCWEATVPNTVEGIQRVLGEMPPTTPWVVEPTGEYSSLLVDQAQAAGRTVLQAPPKAAKAFLGVLSPRAKTDRLDAVGLARYAQAVPLRPFPATSRDSEPLRQLLAARRGLSQSIMRLRQQQQSLPLAEVGTRLQAVPGIGLITATAVAVCLARRSFQRAEQFVAYIGLDLRVCDSGTRRLSKQGDAELRRLLYLAAQAGRRCRAPHPFSVQYEREVAKGLSSTAALCAVARKLARTCFSLAKHGTTYAPARVSPHLALDGQP
jgi:transposase